MDIRCIHAEIKGEKFPYNIIINGRRPKKYITAEIKEGKINK
jgi:hypothetical protein